MTYTIRTYIFICMYQDIDRQREGGGGVADFIEPLIKAKDGVRI